MTSPIANTGRCQSCSADTSTEDAVTRFCARCRTSAKSGHAFIVTATSGGQSAVFAADEQHALAIRRTSLQRSIWDPARKMGTRQRIWAYEDGEPVTATHQRPCRGCGESVPSMAELYGEVRV